MKKKIFLSTPITNSLNEETGLMASGVASRISQVQELLISLGNKVFLAIDREKWGKELMAPDECTPKDFDGMIDSNHVVVLLTDYLSEGTLIEIGWATGRSIPVTVLCDKHMKLSPLLAGISSIGPHRIFAVDWLHEDNWKTIIKERMEQDFEKDEFK